MNLDLDILDILQALSLLPFLYILNQYLFKKLEEKHSFFSTRLMNVLSVYHLAFGFIYYLYALGHPSDSKKYFSRVFNTEHSWFHFFQTETHFIDFLSYPFIRYLGFNYEMMMVLFTWVGFLGFVYAYLFFKENITLKIKIFKRIDFLLLILFLPNMHFWTASLGKGAPIFLGLMLFAYAIKQPQSRLLTLSLGSLLVFAIRPHMLLLIAAGSIIGVLMSKHSISWQEKSVFIAACTGLMFLFHEPILEVVKLNNSDNLYKDFMAFTSNRAEDLAESGTGVNMTEYSLVEKFFTFWFRPLFFDAPGIFGVIVSIENLIYLFLFAKIFRLKFFRFLKNAPANVKASLALFIITSFAMTFIMSNLGIIIRQKTMIMYFMFFVIYYYLGHEQGISINLNARSQEGKLSTAA
ncbi:hypothetical protein [Christiangramia salexigens]|uniref:Glycosyltransferase RgtA/B/C/D-like domain-containing protein n=1 Tax=Christiangramia salexigens TaxID=1913577 RepID=A0A1L3J6A0_9FLAO|nr:hypothetical protein [Christiangramia salexigens]APG60669.1 hypothetical protein LPB144_09755 [Christiangramia salexigens]